MNAPISDALAGSACWSLVCADNRDLLPMLPDKCVAHLITDPPYSADVHSKQWVSAALTTQGAPRVSSKHKALGFAALTLGQMREIASESSRLVNRWALAFTDVESAFLWKCLLEGSGLEYVRTCIWDKVDSAPQFTGDRPASAAEALACAHRPGRKKWNGGGRRNVFSVAVNGSEPGGKEHPAQKPLPLMLELVSLFTDPGEVVLDPFAGSATTGVACLRLGRRFIGIEKDPAFARLAIERMEAEEQGLLLKDARAGQLPLFARENTQ